MQQWRSRSLKSTLTGLADPWEPYTLLQHGQAMDTNIDIFPSLAKKTMFIFETGKVRKPVTSPTSWQTLAA